MFRRFLATCAAVVFVASTGLAFAQVDVNATDPALAPTPSAMAKTTPGPKTKAAATTSADKKATKASKKKKDDTTTAAAARPKAATPDTPKAKKARAKQADIPESIEPTTK